MLTRLRLLSIDLCEATTPWLRWCEQGARPTQELRAGALVPLRVIDEGTRSTRERRLHSPEMSVADFFSGFGKPRGYLWAETKRRG